MSIIQKTISILLVALLAGFLNYTATLNENQADVDSPKDKAPANKPPAPDKKQTAPDPNTKVPDLEHPLTNSAQCQACHPKIYEEWKQDQHSTAWTEEVFVTYTESYNRVECLSCHAPKPMLEIGIEKEPVLRDKTSHRGDGVGCFACHMKNGKSHGTLGSKAACGGILEPALKTSQACYHCHHTHNLFKEYLASEYPKKGVSCQDCHMKEVERAVAVGGKIRKTRRHFIHAGGHDVEALKTVLKLDLAEKDGQLTVTVTNIGAGHGVPGEINNRIVRLEISVLVPAKVRPGEAPIPGGLEEIQAFQEIFRAPPRLSRNKIPSTQILPGEPRVLTYKLNAKHGKISASLTFKIEPYILNSEAVPMTKKDLKF